MLRCIKTEPDDSFKLELERSVAELTSSNKETPMDSKSINQMTANTKDTPMDTMPDFDIGHDDVQDLGCEEVYVSKQYKVQSSGNKQNVVFPEVKSNLHARLEGSTSEQIQNTNY